MRITGGIFKGKILFYKKNSRLRPTQSIVREAIFNMLAGNIEGKNVADFFAGTGALGFEALSRGASSVTFVDSSADAIRILEKNTELLNLTERVKIMRTGVESAIRKLANQSNRFGLIFADPPYGSGYTRIKKIISGIEMILKDDGIFVLETPSKTKEYDSMDIDGFERIKEKRYGSTRIQIYQKKRATRSLSR